MEQNWNGKTILMLGAARQGQALVRFMAGRGANVILSDAKPIEKLSSAVEALRDLPIRWEVGGHPLSLLDGVQAVFVTGGADLRIPILCEATNRRIPIMNDTQVFLDNVPAPVIGITGSAGKTTTTTLVKRMAEAAATPGQKVWTGGNIGLPLLTFVDQIAPTDIVILEMSSFQLEILNKSPHISALLNITPNHLDRHCTMAAYTAAKANIFKFQKETDLAILSRDDNICQNLSPTVHGELFSFGMQKPHEMKESAAIFHDGRNILRLSKQKGEIVEELLIADDSIQLRGMHNISNVMAACAIASAAAWPISAMKKGVEGFHGVAHRLEWVRKYHGADWYNDSIATAPERTLAAVHSFTEPLILLLGGRDKKLPWDTLGIAIQNRARCAILFGEAAPMIKAELKKCDPQGIGPQIIECEGLQEAVQRAAEKCQSGDVVLLSPGGTSYDAFVDFEERGRAFTEWTQQLI